MALAAVRLFSSVLPSLVFVLWLVCHPVSSLNETPTEQVSLQHKVVCQSQKLKLRCFNSSYRIDIEGGTYGRTLPGSVVCKYQGHENDFYYNCGSNDVEDKLIDLCENKKRCNFVVGKSLFGDRCRGRAYLEIVYRCVYKERKRPKNKSTSPTISSTLQTLTTNQTIIFNTTDYPTQNTSLNGTIIPDFMGVTTYTKPGVIMSMIVWIVYIKERWAAFRLIFVISAGASLGLFVIISILYCFFKRRKRKQKRRPSTNNKDLHQTLNPVSVINGDLKRFTELDALSNSFPAPISTLPPPPDDMIYPSPTPDMMNATRPPPPPAPRVASLDDISKLDQDRNTKNVEITRSMSMRARPSDYYSKDLNYDRFHPKLQPLPCCPEINAVLSTKDSAMYMNPMYENGHVKEVTR